MALKLVASKNYTMRSGEFVWGFDPAAPDVMSPRSLGGGGDIAAPERLSRALLAQLAKAGWNAASLDVLVNIYDGGERGLFRYVSKVRGNHRGKPFELDFSGKLSNGYNFVPGRFKSFELGQEKFPQDTRKWTDDQADIFEDVVMSAISAASCAPPSPAASDVTSEGDGSIRRLFQCVPIPAPRDFPVLYCWVPTDQLDRRPEDVILTATGLILVSDYGPDDIPLLPERRYDSFDYASTDISVKADQGMFTVPDMAVPVEIKLKDLNEIYVMDMAARDDVRARVDAAIQASGRRESSREEFCEIQTADAKTMIPVTEYRGDFRRPVYVIGRHLLADEARFMKGQVRVVFEDGVLAITMEDRQSGGVVVFQSCDNAGIGRFHHMVRDADAISHYIGCELDIDAAVHEEMVLRKARYDARRAANAAGPKL